MKAKGIPPNATTFFSILKVCGAMGAFRNGKQVHEEIESAGFLKEGASVALGNAIVDMYGRLGALSKAQDVFDEIPVRDVVSWNALIGGYGRHGHVQKACSCFGWMQIEGICPDRVTFLCLLNALSCSGLIEEAGMCFTNTIRSFGSMPGLEQHHSCMVTLLGCAGYFEDARSVIQTVPVTDLSVGVALLSVCRRWSCWKLGESIFSQQVRDFARSGSFCAAWKKIYSMHRCF
jgi:pentatricopeptide repeat protein